MSVSSKCRHQCVYTCSLFSTVLFLCTQNSCAIALLQVSAKQLLGLAPSNLADQIPRLADQKQCLNFLHIPKNAGTSIEDQAWEAQETGWGRKDKTLKCDSGFSEPVPNIPSCNFTDANGQSGECPYWHVPPAMDSALALSYSQCDTFCIVRHPVSRLVSELLWEGRECNDTIIEEAVLERLADTSASYEKSCHWVPQSTYVYGFGGSVHQDQPFCKWVLKFESLKPEFEALMQQYGLPIKLKDHHNSDSDCPANLSVSTLSLIEQHYSSDFEAFGYQKHEE